MDVYVVDGVPACHPGHTDVTNSWSLAEKDGDKVRKLTSICPKDHIVLIRVISALKKIEEHVFCLEVDVSSVRPEQWFINRCIRYPQVLLTLPSSHKSETVWFSRCTSGRQDDARWSIGQIQEHWVLWQVRISIPVNPCRKENQPWHAVAELDSPQIFQKRNQNLVRGPVQRPELLLREPAKLEEALKTWRWLNWNGPGNDFVSQLLPAIPARRVYPLFTPTLKFTAPPPSPSNWVSQGPYSKCGIYHVSLVVNSIIFIS